MDSQAAVDVTSSGHLQRGSLSIPGSVSRDSQNADARSHVVPSGKANGSCSRLWQRWSPSASEPEAKSVSEPVLLLPWNMQDAPFLLLFPHPKFPRPSSASPLGKLTWPLAHALRVDLLRKLAEFVCACSARALCWNSAFTPTKGLGGRLEKAPTKVEEEVEGSHSLITPRAGLGGPGSPLPSSGGDCVLLSEHSGKRPRTQAQTQRQQDGCRQETQHFWKHTR